MSAIPSIAAEASRLPRPEGLIEGPDVWTGESLAGSTDWMLELTGAEIDALDTALESVKSRGLDIIDVRADDFPLGCFEARVRAMREAVLRGRGFALLRGMPVSRYSFRDAALVYWGIGRHLGVPVSQNAAGHLLGHVIDIGREENDPNARIYQTNVRQFYHSDSADIVALLCWRKAKRGGASTIVSSVAVYNEMFRRAPELADELFEPMYFDRRGEVPPGLPPWYMMPVFNWCGGKLSTHYVRRYIESARRFDDVPPLTDAQVAAFDLMDQIMDEPSVHLSMAFEPGDMQFIHNPQILHDRTGFEDFDEPERRRHLLRLWLCATDGRELPACYAQRWGSHEPAMRGGIVVEGQRQVAPLEP